MIFLKNKRSKVGSALNFHFYLQSSFHLIPCYLNIRAIYSLKIIEGKAVQVRLSQMVETALFICISIRDFFQIFNCQ